MWSWDGTAVYDATLCYVSGDSFDEPLKEVVSWKSKRKKREMQDRIREKGFEEFFISTGLTECFDEILDLPLCRKFQLLVPVRQA
jgi:hypothetical protein